MAFSDFHDGSLVSEFDRENAVEATPLEQAAQRRLDAHRRYGDVSAVFGMRHTRYKHALAKIVIGAITGGLGAFLIVEIPKTPDLTTNLAIIGAIGLATTLALWMLAARELFGRLKVDGRGVAMLPAWSGYSIPWAEVTSWQMTGEDDVPSEYQQLKLWRSEEAFPAVVDIGWMTADSRGTLRKIIRQIAGQERLD
ncbi:MAG: hypothetical protein JNL96_03630 [Planctomycetaceae bacterium]|nr:hypothetical protein [Planctomycetaceae bacterium]